ncbi:hypothetical protein [Burkholderia mayonis]|uniref:Uncharacterized protein n=1 Tax=Burkholderia mayonis TaxID=1385591 RepID=A0A1B4G177_9BURK|nr:hypothetical protein [Burkholderia mayonis]AOJ09657.1 hypothetical protein WS71_20315 [Burkholderia mayonis]KVE52278.1 hypothetical protein WS71_10140 [Burkholderia mayonis]
MKIECVLHRKGGTVVDLSGKIYKFAPTVDDSRHIADVTVDAHIERFLSIREAYRIARNPGAEAVEIDAGAGSRGTILPADIPPTVTVDADQLKVAGATFPPSFDINGKTYSLADITLRAFQDSGLTVEDWNSLDDEHRATKTEIVLDALEAGEIAVEPAVSAPTSQQSEADERAALVAAYIEKFGKAPAANIKVETLKVKLAEGTE